MKSIWILLILCYVAVAKKYNKDECSLKSISRYAHKTFPNSIDVVANLFSKDSSDDELTCLIACYLYYWAHDEGKSLSTVLLGFTNETYAKGFETKKFTRKEVESKIVNCANDTEQDDYCAFFKCIDFFHTPFFDLVQNQPSFRSFISARTRK